MNYGDLKSHFNDLLNRSDITSSLTTRFIDQGIARIQRQLRTPLNEKKKDYTITGQANALTLPTDFLEIISLYANEFELRRITMSKYRQLVSPSSYTGNPQYFVREQEKLKIFPEPTTGTVSLYYYGEFDAMSADSDEKKLAEVAPDLILYAALTYASDYYMDERSTLFEQKYQQFLSEIQEQSNDQELNGGPQSIRPSYEYGDE